MGFAVVVPQLDIALTTIGAVVSIAVAALSFARSPSPSRTSACATARHCSTSSRLSRRLTIGPSRRLGGSPDVLTSSLRLALIGASNETGRPTEPPCPRVRCCVQAIGQTYNVAWTVSSHDSFAISVVRKTLLGVFA